MTNAILGISAFYHDSAAALLIDGRIVAAAQEERFTRKKQDASFPMHAIAYVLQEAGMAYDDLTAVAFYDKPLLKFERLLETYHAFAPRGRAGFSTSIPVWIKEKLFMKKLLRGQLKEFGKAKLPLLFPEHHLSHAASAYYPSPFTEAAILTVDGVGEWATTTICHGKSNQISICKELHFPHSVGLLYAAFTYFLGFKVNSGEYKLMGLAPYGNPASPQTAVFKEKILAELVDIREDGSILLNMHYFDFATSLRMTNNKRWEELFGFPAREPESALNQAHMNLARAIQEITESVVLALAREASKITQSKNLVMAGGVALNCVANSKIADAKIFHNIWIQPASGDAGGSLGAAYAAFHIWNKQPRTVSPSGDSMKAAFLGPEYPDKEIRNMIRYYDASYDHFKDFGELSAVVSRKLADGNVIGWFQDRMEFGPRALGNRSILGDPGNRDMQRNINLKIKFREAFRPFAPSILAEDYSTYFKSGAPSPYMLFVSAVREAFRTPAPENEYELDLADRLHHARSTVPAVTHIDYSSRVQTVDQDQNPRFWHLLNDFKKITGYGMLINTSFNVRGEPIVCSPADAYRAFIRTDMDWLVIGNYLFDKKNQRKDSIAKVPEVDFGFD